MTIDVPISPTPRVSVIIPTKTLDLALCVLRSLARWIPLDAAIETIVVLNGTTGQVAINLTRQVNGIRTVASTVNRGLAGACNLGRSVARGELLVVLHDDAEIEQGWLEALVTAADEVPDAGVIGSKVLFPDGTLQTAGMVLWQDASVSPPWVGDAPFAGAFSEPRTVDYCGSSSVLVRAELWDAIGGLEERLFPAYFVDVDLAMSARECGWVVLYEPRSVIRHRRGASTTDRFRSFLSQRNRALFIEKWRHALGDQLVNDGDVHAAVQRAADRPRKAKPPHDEQSPPVVRDDSVYAEMAAVVQDEYVRYLTESLDRTEEELRTLAARVAERDAALARLRVASRYRLGSRLEFRAGGMAHNFHHQGGYAPEDWGMWLGATPFTISLPPEPADEPGGQPPMLSVELEAVSYLGENRTASPFTVSINGHIVAELTETRQGLQCYTVTVPLTAPDAQEGLVIRVVGDAPARPAAAQSFPRDDRSLSVGLVALTVGSV